ncbi:MAG TPA: sulfatase-like hydrolase/transferase [Opitutaceae bacterium]|nr:sulfatase-like hydrolase/transferase [Opitutaceae bacterium]
MLLHRHGAVTLALGFAFAVGLLTRLALLFKASADVAWNFSLVAAFLWGALFDLAAALWWALPLALVLALLPARFFERAWGRALAHAGFVVLLFALLFGAVAEWIFWDEFGVRFNFIAVDYLVYTKEVLGNIRESYPMPAIYGGLLVVSAGLYALVLRTGCVGRWLQSATATAGVRWRAAAGWAMAALALGLGLQQALIPGFANNYNRELAKGGLWSLFAAFWSNHLDYEQFYPTTSDDAAFERMHAILARDGAQRLTSNPRDLLRLVRHEGPELRLNVIQITVESLSASFLSSFNRAAKLTPNLEEIAKKSLVFERFYATGTRTDRGMEALTLSVPPTPGRSLIKRPDNENLFTLGSVFRSKGYETAFIYGGFGYFDNMNYFFGENGYRVVDRTKVAKEDITFANIWGACDEDLFRWTVREADRDHAAGRPFFHFVMTTSNHRPFTYPDGKIDLPSKIAGRSGGVKYSDYAIGEFFRVAATKPWFKSTIFVIVGDHCASSAGKTELPVQNYHIPLLVYAPGGQIKPQPVSTLMSQVDFAPTLLGLLRWTYPSRFYGWDVLAAPHDQPGRALIGNYQKLGLYRSGELGVLKPVGQSLTLSYDRMTHEMKPQPDNSALIGDTIAYYQTASWLFQNGQQRALTPKELESYEAFARLQHDRTTRLDPRIPARPVPVVAARIESERQ